MPLDLILRRVRIAGNESEIVDIGFSNGKIEAIESKISAEAPEEDAGGRLVCPGFVETHIHLDKSCLFHIAEKSGTLNDAIGEVTAAKRSFTEADVYTRAKRTLEKAIVQGTTHMRTHVEIDPRVGLKSFHAIRELRKDFAWAIDLEICVFPQEGLLNDPGAEELLVQACEQGADLIGGCPYTDRKPHEQISRIFGIAKRFDLDIDFHLDFDLNPEWMDLDEVCRQAGAQKWGGRVTVGHVTKLSALPATKLADAAVRMKNAGIAVTVLPSTDLFLMGREYNHNVPRGVAPAHKLSAHGVTCSLATNNVLNPFTPFGDCSLVRMANLYANIAQRGAGDLPECFEFITSEPANLMNLKNYGIKVGNPADVVVLDCETRALAVAEIAQPLMGFKSGKKTFTKSAPRIHVPNQN